LSLVVALGAPLYSLDLPLITGRGLVA
jgi:hypothetical protein